MLDTNEKLIYKLQSIRKGLSKVNLDFKEKVKYLFYFENTSFLEQNCLKILILKY